MKTFTAIPVSKSKTRKVLKKFSEATHGGKCTHAYNDGKESLREDIVEMIEAKIKRNDNKPLMAGLSYALSLAKGL